MNKTQKPFLALIISVLILQPYQGSFSAFASQPQRMSQGLVRTKLFKDSRERLARALVQGQKDLLLVIASAVGGNDLVANQIGKLGGTVLYRDDSVDYIRARVPSLQVETLTSSDGVESADVDADPHISYSAPLISNVTASSSSEISPVGSPPGPNTPLSNPYFPIKDIGSPQLHAEHPTFDGRGVAVAIIDQGFDLLAPELQTAKTIDGREVPKILDFLTSTEPGDREDPDWVDMNDSVIAQNSHLTYKEIVYTAPADGAYRIGLLSDGSLPGNGRTFGILWDEITKTVWVDTNQNQSFADEKGMKEYAVRQDIGVFGKDNPVTPIRESIGFTVQIHPVQKYININIGRGFHGTATAGIAVGKNYFGGKMSAAASESQLVFIKRGTSIHAFIKAMIMAAKDPRVEAISQQWGAGTYRREDRKAVDRIVVGRLVERYNKLFIFPAGNGIGLNGISDSDASPKVLTVSGYIGKETWLANFGVTVAKKDYQIWSWGPGPGGELKPDILSIASAVSTAPGWMPGRSVARVYSLPPGYRSEFSGSSLATPATLGGAAQLISAAKQSRIPYDAKRLRRAIISSARYLSDYAVYQQGNGLLQVDAAWQILARLSSVEDLDQIVSRAPVRTSVSQFFDKPHEGTGIYEREGWTIGHSGTRAIIFTRTSGRAEPVTYNITWTGNDGTFSCGESITLPLNVPVRMPIRIRPMSLGVHSAILNLVDRRTAGYAYQVMNTVVTPEKFGKATQYTIEHSTSIERPGRKSFYFYVPENVPALNVSWKLPPNTAYLYVVPPSGKWVTTTLVELVEGRPSQATSRTYASPPSGVWEVAFGNTTDERRFDESSPNLLSPTPVSLTLSLLGAELDIKRTGVEMSEQGTVNRYSANFRSLLAPLESPKVEVDLTSSFSGRYTVKPGEQQVYDIDVPTGANLVMARLGKASDPEADLDLYLFDCTTGQCRIRSKSAENHSDERVLAYNPKAGRWKVVIDCFSARTSGVDFDYQDLFSDNRLGSAKINTSGQGQSQQWKDIYLSIASGPEIRRSIKALVQLRSSDAFSIQDISGSQQDPHVNRDAVPLGMKIISVKGK